MNKHSAPGWFVTAFLVAVLFTTGGAVAQATEIGHPTFLSPHASPILKNGGRVFVVNTAADTVDVIDVSSRTILTRINVGIDQIGKVDELDLADSRNRINRQ